MRKIKLTPEAPFQTRCDVTVYDVTDGREKKRCKIQVEYSAYDVEQLKKKGMDHDAAIEHYREWIYDVVKYYILDDWECTEGLEEILSIVDGYIKKHFEEEDKA